MTLADNDPPAEQQETVREAFARVADEDAEAAQDDSRNLEHAVRERLRQKDAGEQS